MRAGSHVQGMRSDACPFGIAARLMRLPWPLMRPGGRDGVWLTARDHTLRLSVVRHRNGRLA
jgi:hypothetical protein